MAVFSDRFRAHQIEQQRGELTVALNVAPLQPKPARQQRTTPAQGDGAHLQQHLVEQSRVGKLAGQVTAAQNPHVAIARGSV